jgi:hypothetical protein
MAKRSLPSTRSFHDAGMALPRAATLRVGDLAAAAMDRAGDNPATTIKSSAG